MRYRVIVDIKATRVVTLEADSGPEALRKAEAAAFTNRHPRDKVKSLIVTGYPKKSPARVSTKPSIRVP